MEPSASRRTVLLLTACYGLSMSSISLSVATAPIVGLALAPSPAWATLPLSLQTLATMAASMPASLLMGRIGRRRGFNIGLLFGAAGAVLAVLGILVGSFLLFCAGAAFIGALNGFTQLYRFAAADVAPTWRAKAISWVLVGGVLAGVLGPAVAAGAADALPARFAGSYAAILGLYALTAVALRGAKMPRPERLDDRDARPLRRIAQRPIFMAAVLAAMVSYGAMAMIMTATPISMQDAGHAFGAAAMVIQVHVVMMFAPSFFTGHLIARFGTPAMMASGLGFLLAATIINASGHTFAHFMAALALLGLGWNFLFIAGSSLVASLHRPSETYKVQGLNDALVFGTAAAGSFAAGGLATGVGWTAMNAYAAPALVAAGGVLVILGLLARDRPAADSVAVR